MDFTALLNMLFNAPMPAPQTALSLPVKTSLPTGTSLSSGTALPTTALPVIPALPAVVVPVTTTPVTISTPTVTAALTGSESLTIKASPDGKVTLKDGRRLNGKEKKNVSEADQSLAVALQAQQPPLPQVKPPIQIPSAQTTQSPLSYGTASGTASATLAAAQPVAPPPVATQNPVIQQPAQATENLAPLVFGAQLTESETQIAPAPSSTQAARMEMPANSPVVQDTATPDVGNTPPVKLSSTPAPPLQGIAQHAAKSDDPNTSAKDKQPDKGPDKQSFSGQLDDTLGRTATPRQDSGTTPTVVEAKATPSKSTAPAPVPASSDTNVESKSEINPTLHPQPAKEISLRVPTADSTVDLKFTDRAGKVQVSVRSSDPELARSLQSNLGDLVGHLEKKGFDTETWVPSERSNPTAIVAEPSSPGNESRNSQQQSGGDAQQQGSGRQQGQGQGQRPKWLDELDLGFSLDSSSGANIQ